MKVYLIQQQNITCCSIHFQFCLNSCQTGNELVDLRAYNLFLTQGLKKQLLLMVPFFSERPSQRKTEMKTNLLQLLFSKQHGCFTICNKWKQKNVKQLVYCLLDLPDASCCTNTSRGSFILWRSLQLKSMNKMINDILKFSILLNSWTIRTRHIFGHTTAQLWYMCISHRILILHRTDTTYYILVLRSQISFVWLFFWYIYIFFLN